MTRNTIVHTGASRDAHDAFVKTVDSLIIAGLAVQESIAHATANLNSNLQLTGNTQTAALNNDDMTRGNGRTDGIL